MSVIQRVFGKIQTGRRIAIPQDTMKLLEWKVGDQVCLHIDSNRITVENLEAKWRKEK